MTIELFTLIFLTTYSSALLFLGFSTSQGTSEDYLIGSRDIGIGSTIASLSTGFRDGVGFVFWLTMAINFGYG